MLDQLREKTTFLLCRVSIQNDSADMLEQQNARPQNVRAIHEQPEALVGNNSSAEEEKAVPFQYVRQKVDPNDPKTWGKVARNDLCPCGSGKKYKHCHGQVA